MRAPCNSTTLARAAIAFVLAWVAFAVALAADVPYLSGRVVDDAEILRPATREAIAGRLAAHEQKTTNQVAVLTIPTIGDEGIEEFATRAFGTWRLGQRGKDNGVLVVVVPKDRKMRIEVGYGLEGTLTDAAASRIIRNVMTPAFKAGDFDKGVADGVDAIVGQLEGTRDVAKIADVPAPSHSSGGLPMRIDDPGLPPWPVRILLACFIFGIIGLFTFFGIVTPGAGWFLYFFLIPFWAMFPIVILGAQGALVLLIGLSRGISDREARAFAHRVVRESRARDQGERIDDDRRLHRRLGVERRLVVRRQQQRRRRLFGRRRQLGRRRRVGELVSATRGLGCALATHLDVLPRRLATMMQAVEVIAQRRELVGDLQREALASAAPIHHQLVEQLLALGRGLPRFADAVGEARIAQRELARAHGLGKLGHPRGGLVGQRLRSGPGTLLFPVLRLLRRRVRGRSRFLERFPRVG
jgi:uncharacterized protein